MHNERCQKCKKTILKILQTEFEEVLPQFKFNIGTYPKFYKNTFFHNELDIIFRRLRAYRGYNNFVKAKTLPVVDYFVPTKNIVLEFDESQHFSKCRKESLKYYPKNLNLGFDLSKWKSICDKENSKDNDPVYRDEQRAWYDVLRDFLPSLVGIETTVRIYSKDFHWCSLNPNLKEDRIKFLKYLPKVYWNNINESKKSNLPLSARIIINGKWEGNINSSKNIINEICNNYYRKRKIDFLSTCGGFLFFEWPKIKDEITNNIYPDKVVLERLVRKAQETCEKLLDRKLINKLKKISNYITIGIDSFKDKVSYSDVNISNPHVELVALIDLNNNKYHWTGKFYPTLGQQLGLIRFSDIKSHFVKTPFGKLLMLGCHDLNILNPRTKSITKKPWRKRAKNDFKKLLKSEKPKIVLHHPHTTDSRKIWTNSWSELIKLSPSVKTYLGSGRYYYEGKPVRSSLDEVLLKTKLGNVINFVFYS